MKKSLYGFTLIEVLVAMTILAVVLAAANHASSLAISHSMELRQRILADMVAHNRIAYNQSMDIWQTGTFSGETTQGGLRFEWREEMTPTPNPAFMKIVVTVSSRNQPHHQLRRLVSYLNNPAYQYAKME